MSINGDGRQPLLDKEVSVSVGGDGGLLDYKMSALSGSRWYSNSVAAQAEAEEEKKGGQLGTIMGVFVPTVLSIFGVILFIRLGWIIGQAGVLQALAMFVLGYTVVTFTTISLSAIATNGVMKGGGAYYLISRALGPELGGSIGLIFWAANVCGCAVYLLGFAESAADAFGFLDADDRWGSMFVTALLALIVLTGVVFAGADYFAKANAVIFAVLIVSIITALVSFLGQSTGATEGFTGIKWDTLKDNFGSRYDDDTEIAGFFTTFSILFPACTGIMAGANMSGDLKTPSQSIPKGTLWALLTTFVGYSGLVLIIGASVDGVILAASETGYPIMSNVSFVSELITAGIFCAVLSSAMGALIGGAKILQALARDDLLGFLSIFKAGSAKKDEPHRATLFTMVLVLVLLVASDDLNVLATFQTLFFLLSYALVNLAALSLGVQGSMNWRPTFAWSSPLNSGLGFLLCVATMLATSLLATFISLLLLVVIAVYVSYTSSGADWGDISQSLIYHQVRKYLLRLDPDKMHIKFWRPQILMLVDDVEPARSHAPLHFANSLKKGGLLVLGSVITGEDSQAKQSDIVQMCNSLSKGWGDFIKAAHIKAFHDSVCSTSLPAGLRTMMQMSGIGVLRPNTVLLTLPGQPAALAQVRRQERETLTEVMEQKFPKRTADPRAELPGTFMRMLRDVVLHNNNLLLCRNMHLLDEVLLDRRLAKFQRRETRFVDIWVLPCSDSASMHMCVLLAWILAATRSNKAGWRKYSKLRLNAIVHEDEDERLTVERLDRMMDVLRMPGHDIRTFHPRDYPLPAAIEEKVADDEVAAAAAADAGLPTSRELAQYNAVMQANCQSTGASFVPMPPIPRAAAWEEEETEEDESGMCKLFVQDLNSLTEDMGPVVLVHAPEFEFSTAI